MNVLHCSYHLTYLREYSIVGIVHCSTMDQTNFVLSNCPVFCRIFSSILGLHPLDASDSSLCHQAIKKVFRHFQKSCLAEFQSLNTESFLVSFCNSIVLHFVNVPQFIQAVPYSQVYSLSLIKRVLQRMVSCPHHFVFLVEFLKQDHLVNGLMCI